MAVLRPVSEHRLAPSKRRLNYNITDIITAMLSLPSCSCGRRVRMGWLYTSGPQVPAVKVFAMADVEIASKKIRITYF